MCIKKKIEEIQKQIDERLKLKSLLEKTQPLLTSISVICADYREVAPEELPFLMDEILQAAQVDLSVAAISAIATTGDEKAQDFVVDAMTQPIEHRASVAFEVTREAEKVQQSNFAPEPEYEPEESTNTVQGILNSRGFYEPDINLGDAYDPEEKQGSYGGWDIYCSVHDSGKAMSIGLENKKLGEFWDVGTEYLLDYDPSFPKSLLEKQPILAWVRSVIDLLPTISDTSLTGEEYDRAVEDELGLDDEDISEPEPPNLIEQFSITNLPLPHQEMRARVTPATGDRPPFLGKFAGATFTFYRGFQELFSSSQTVDEIAKNGNNPELIAVALAERWLKSQELKNLPPAGTTHTEPPAKDEFTELVYLSGSVAYFKRRDTGELLTAYLGFSNKTPEGDRAPTMAKSRAMKWQEHLVGVYQLACSGPRECQRIESKNPKQPFKYELKLVKPSMGQLQALATENFGLYPNEVEEKQEGCEAKRESLVPPTEIKFSDFEFERAADFDELNPEFSVTYQNKYLTKVWSSLRTTAGQQPQRLWRHRLLKRGEEIEFENCEAAVLHALQRTRGLA